MMRVVLLGLLLLVVTVTALGVVLVRHENRLGFAELVELERQRDEMNTDWGRLQLEHAMLSSGTRVDQLARDELGLSNPEHIELVRP